MAKRLTMLALACGAIGLLVAAPSARADTGVLFTCLVRGEPDTTVYLDSTGKLASFEQGEAHSQDVAIKNGAFRAKIGHRLFRFVPVWPKNSYKLTITGPKGTHSGPCKMP
ncbi:MAG: hypothetical protein ACHP84_12495 [Caulobacterales bacterium]